MRKGRKIDQVLAGAREVFLSDGFEGANVDEIARRADVSKATLYSYFSTKTELFLTVATKEIARITDEATLEVDTDQPVQNVLTKVAELYVGFYASDFGLNLFRTCVAEARHFPEIGREFYQAGLVAAHDRLRNYLVLATERGELDMREDEQSHAAFQFTELCRAGLLNKRLFYVQDDFSASEIAKFVSSAVEMFLARYSVKPQAV